MAKEFLLEIGTEEIPARFMKDALNQLKNNALQLMKEYRFKTAENDHFIITNGTPRRLLVLIKGLEETQESAETEAKGPSVKAAFDENGQPTKAAQGFARGQGVDVSELVVKNTGAGEYVFAIKREEGREIAGLLPEFCLRLINSLNFPKPMRWADHEMRFVRPVRWLLALFGSDIIPFEVAGTASGRLTYGHRFLKAGSFEINDPADYFNRIEEMQVMVDVEARRQKIRSQVQTLTENEGGLFKTDDDFEELLEEVIYLVEYPDALLGTFEADYLKLPKEVVVTPMREHQRYFPIEKPDGNLLPRFIAVSNGINNNLVKEGNEKVLKARLADAKFFYDEDLKVNLIDNVDKLKKIVFQESLGTLYAKVERIVALGEDLTQMLQISEPDSLEAVKRAGYLCKADLVSNVVYEFPELQGIMGKYYARHSAEDEVVAEAIFEHYLPRFAGDLLPKSQVGQILSIVDKLDTLVGCFAVGIQPTGSQDPYALRRQALGVCHIIINSDFRFSLPDLIARAYAKYSGKIEPKLTAEETVNEVMEFFRQRVRNILESKDISYDVIDAVLASGFDDIIDTLNRAEALTNLRSQDIFGKLLTAYNRVANLAKKAETDHIEPALLEEEAEVVLYREFLTASEEFKTYLREGQYRQLFQRFALLQQPIDRFFETIMVMVEEEKVRTNRLALLKKITNLMLPIADLTKIVQ